MELDLQNYIGFMERIKRLESRLADADRLAEAEKNLKAAQDAVENAGDVTCAKYAYLTGQFYDAKQAVSDALSAYTATKGGE